MSTEPLTRRELAELLHISERTLSNYVEQGKLPRPFVTLHRVHYWNRKQIAAYLGVDVEHLPKMGKRAPGVEVPESPLTQNSNESAKDTPAENGDASSPGVWARLRWGR
jgi:hypothetical protein